MREYLWINLTAASLLAPSIESGSGAEARPWFERSLVGMEIGPTGAQFGHSDTNDARYCAHFDGREMVRRAVAAHSEYLVFWARDGDWAYYDSTLLPKPPGLGDRDPLRDALNEAGPLRLPVLAYCVVQQGGNFLAAHPEFEMRGPDQKRLGRFCYNSGYLDAMKAILSEQLAYGIAGFHIDMLDQGFGPPYGCWCELCRGRFEKEFGHAMPKGVTWDAAWDDMLEFRYRASERFEQALMAHVKSVQPRATVDFNYHGNPPFSWEVGQRPVQHARNADFVTGETGVWGFSALTVGLNAEFYRAATPGLPFQVAMQRGVRMYHDQTTRPLHDLRWELFTLLAHGALVTMVDKTAFDGALDPVAYDRIGAAFQEARSKRAHFGQKPAWEVGLYFSSRTRDWYGRDNPARYFQSFQGAHKACVLEHVQAGVLLDENLSPELLGSFPIVCLPDAAILSDREVKLFRDYVEQGGKLLVTGQSGQYDRTGHPLNASVLEELTGGRVTGRLASLDNWVRLPPEGDDPSLGSALGQGIQQNWPFLVKGPATIYSAGTAKSGGELLRPYRTTRQQQGKEGTDWPMSPEAVVGPAYLVNQVGKGTVLTLAGSPDWATASEHAVVEARRLFRNAVRALASTPRVRVHAPPNVEAVVTDDAAARTLRIHLVAYNSTPQTTPAKGRPFVLPGLIEDAPLYRATLVAREPLRSARALSSSTELRRKGAEVEVTVADIHEVILLEY